MTEESLPILVSTMLSVRLVLLLAASATALNLGAPVVRSTRPSLRRPLAVMQVEEEAMTEEEYEAELAAQEAKIDSNVKEVEEDILSPQEVEAMKAKIANYAPWMSVDPEAIARAKKAREDRKNAAPTQVDGMQLDPQAAELNAAGGLKSKVLSEDEIELRWETSDEAGNAGFIVQRRAGGAADFENLVTYENFAPLKTKGVQGGTYVYLILDCDTSGVKSAMCQKLVEIESGDEQKQTLVIGVGIALLALVFVGAGLFIDPIQTTATGRGF